jgi:hypothetical protein
VRDDVVRSGCAEWGSIHIIRGTTRQNPARIHIYRQLTDTACSDMHRGAKYSLLSVPATLSLSLAVGDGLVWIRACENHKGIFCRVLSCRIMWINRKDAIWRIFLCGFHMLEFTVAGHRQLTIKTDKDCRLEWKKTFCHCRQVWMHAGFCRAVPCRVMWINLYIKTCFKIPYEGLACIGRVRNKIQWQGFVMTLMNLWISLPYFKSAQYTTSM